MTSAARARPLVSELSSEVRAFALDEVGGFLYMDTAVAPFGGLFGRLCSPVSRLSPLRFCILC